MDAVQRKHLLTIFSYSEAKASELLRIVNMFHYYLMTVVDYENCHSNHRS